MFEYDAYEIDLMISSLENTRPTTPNPTVENQDAPKVEHGPASTWQDTYR
jgi:hypothetical protein